MSAIPKWALGLDWTGWKVAQPEDGPAYMTRTVKGFEDVLYQIRIHKGNYLEIFLDGAEAGLDATFPKMEGALSVARSFIEGMGE
jgi:hypothetical protein